MYLFDPYKKCIQNNNAAILDVVVVVSNTLTVSIDSLDNHSTSGPAS